MKVPTPRKLPSGNYFLRLRLNGSSIPITKHTAQECISEAALIKAQYLKDGKKSPQPALKEEITLRQAIDKYIAERQLSPSTVRGYRYLQKYQFVSIMDKPVKSITDDEIRAEIKKSLEKNKVKTVKNAWGLVKGVLKRQKREPPEIIFPPTVAEKLPYLKQKEIAAFLCALKGTPHELAALLALSSLRRSEIAALDWDKGSVEIKKDGVLIHVKGAVVHDEHNKLVEKSENKNATSRRTLRVEIPRLSELLINEPNKHGKVVRTSIHHYYDGINRVCRQIGLPNVGVHGLRRSFASLARKVNLSRKAVKEIGGWSDYKVVDKMYDQFDADERMEAENKLGEWFRDLKV